MATPVWKNIFSEVPADGATVWIVRIPYFDTPVQATYDEMDSLFSWQTSNAHGETISINAVFKWRDL